MDVQLLAADAVPFVPSRLARPSFSTGISRATAATLVRAFCSCPRCEAAIDPDVRDSQQEDRDVVWASRETPRTNPHTCPECHAPVRILAEEKTLSVVGEEYLSDELPDTPDTDVEPDATIYYVPVDGPDSDTYLRVNSFQLMLSVEGDDHEPAETTTRRA
jgi:hypothetical protein